MTDFPITAIKHTLDHSGGTKSFHLYVLTHKDSGRSLFVTRWGKTGAFGQVKVEQHSTAISGSRAFDKKLEEKEKGGYRGTAIPNFVECPTQGNLTGYIGPQLTSTISPSDWNWLKTGSEDKVLTAAQLEANKRQEDRLAEQAAAAERKREAERLLQEQILREQEEERAKAQQSIPNWGRF
jgi:predicted DNA-binding WGR domain protein